MTLYLHALRVARLRPEPHHFLDEQPAQPEQPRVLALRHGAEGAVRALAVAVELRRLRMQQQRQRVVGGMAPGDPYGFAT